MNKLPALAILFTMLLPSLLFAAGDNFSPGLLYFIKSHWGEDGQKQVLDWHQLIRTQKSLSIPSLNMQQIEHNIFLPDNAFWNRIPYSSDKSHWGEEDYWATPIETLASKGGDCEDYSIGKYFTMKELGVPIQKLRIVYVRALNWNEPHMVLAYYPEPDADPYIFDNMTDEILPASSRTDLEPVFSFNDDDLWTEKQRPKIGKSNQIRLWQQLIEKMDRERKL